MNKELPTTKSTIAPKPLMVFEAARERLIGFALEARRQIARQGEELCDTFDSTDRVLAEAVVSPMNVPPHDNSAMDGYAVRLADLHANASDDSVSIALPVSQRIAAGGESAALQVGTVARIFTGGVIPSGADAVIMQERTQADGNLIRIQNPAQWLAGEAIRYAGEDIALGSVVAPAGTFITPAIAGLIASVGVASVTVNRPITVACIFTGDELAMPGQALKAGSIYNSNRFVLNAILKNLGCRVIDLGHIPDALEATRNALREAALNADLIISSGGVSVGEEDHVKPAVQAEGELDLWQISMKPGKPLAYGRIRKPDGGHAQFIGLPGNPVSSYITFLLLAQPFIYMLQGRIDKPPLKVQMQADFDFPRADKRREFLRATINDNGRLALFRTQSSGALTSMAYSDGLIDNPPMTSIKRGDWVSFLPFSTGCL